jgi:uncharacterized oxidoreductase
MNLANNTVLITGGSTGIGLALAQRFLQAGSQVLICGRRAEALEAAQRQLPGLHTYVCDVARAEEREDLFHWVQKEHPTVNVLINNAGIQRRVQLAEHDASTDWVDYQRHFGPIVCAGCFRPDLQRH